MAEGSANYTMVEHWTNKGEDVKLALYQKYAGSPDGKKGTILFVHGSSMAATPTFDLQVPGRPYSSAMEYFADQGYDTWCVDMEGYGRSTKDRDIFCDISNGADDLEAASRYIMGKSGCKKMNVYGISSGALRAALFAQRNPDRVNRLALDAHGGDHGPNVTVAAARDALARAPGRLLSAPPTEGAAAIATCRRARTSSATDSVLKCRTSRRHFRMRSSVPASSVENCIRSLPPTGHRPAAPTLPHCPAGRA